MGALDRVFRGRRGGQDRPLAAIVAGLWRNGEQGAWYDSSDLSTMFQDPAGTTPVYMPGQGQPDPWIGLQLDKRLGLVRGPERLTNGDFSAGSAAWAVANNDATHTATFASGALQFKVDSLTPALTLSQLSVMTPGKWYEVTLVVTAWASGTIKTDVFAQASAVLASGPGTFTTRLLAASSVFSFTRGTPTVDITIDSISIRELPGNHRWQGTATSRPVLSARYNLLTKTEDFSVAAAWPTEATGTGSAPVCTARYATAPDGTLTATRLQLSLNGGTAAADRSGVAQTVAAVTQAASYKGVIWLKATTPADIGKTVLLRHVGGTNYHPCVLTADWKAFERVEAAATSYGVFVLGLRGASGGASDSVDILVWGADLRAVTDGVGLPPYQRVVDQSTYDTVGFPLYRKPDGVDDWMQTGAVDFSGTDKVTIAAAVRKLSDTAGMFLESSADSSTVNGAFGVNLAPGALAGSIGARLRGTASAGANAAGHAAPKSLVALIALDIARGGWDSAMSIRVNGTPQACVQEPAFGTTVGAGNLGNHSLYFDRRGGTSLPSAARDYGTIIVGRLLTGPETAAVEKFLRQKSRAY